LKNDFKIRELKWENSDVFEREFFNPLSLLDAPISTLDSHKSMSYVKYDSVELEMNHSQLS